MKTTLDIVELIWARLTPTEFSSTITGKVYKHKRPIGSKVEDVVIETLGTVNVDLQTAIVNVNVHVPDLVIQVNGAQEYQPDNERLKTLSSKVLTFLDDIWGSDYNFGVQQQILIEDPERGEHYINIRIEFFSINVLN